MNDTRTLFSEAWPDYELIDSGDEQKLERFGKYIFIRPEPHALWHKSLESKWQNVDGVYKRSNEGGGKWQFTRKIESQWIMKWEDLQFMIRPTSFKHLGIFPEQTAIWKFIRESIKNSPKPINILNLFAYTGGSTLAAASVGAAVTHVDSSKEILTWARENSKLSHLENKSIRWIPEDAMTFVKREIKRGNTYDAIIMDPPKFGRGNNNEIWKIEEDLPKLLSLCNQILSLKPIFFILNAYAVSLSSLTLSNMLSQSLNKYKGNTIHGELVIKPSTLSLDLPTSIFSIWE